jgi:F0F1-type ATP synthase epsilon subunit
MADTIAQQQSQKVPTKQSLSVEKIRVTVRNRTKVLFDEYVKSVSSKNDTGVFDILPEHSNFISLITSPITIRTIDGHKQEITFNNGLIKVKDNAVHCYVDLLSKELKTNTS